MRLPGPEGGEKKVSHQIVPLWNIPGEKNATSQPLERKGNVQRALLQKVRGKEKKKERFRQLSSNMNGT